jgi:cell division protein FtsQ
VRPGGEDGPVVSRPHLALVPANGLRGRVRLPSARLLGVVALALAAAALLYAGARFTSAFAVEKVEVSGGGPGVRHAVRAAAEPLLGTSLVGFDEDELRRRLEAIPAVHGFDVDRAFPHTLSIAVVQERPLAVIRTGTEAWLVSARGRVLRSLDLNATGKRPVVWAGPDTSLALGGTAAGDDVRAALAALRRRPDGLPDVHSARVSGGMVTLVLASGMELRLGAPEDLGLKLVVANRVLRRLRAQEAAGIVYVDVSVPERAVAGSQLSTLN